MHPKNSIKLDLLWAHSFIKVNKPKDMSFKSLYLNFNQLESLTDQLIMGIFSRHLN